MCIRVYLCVQICTFEKIIHPNHKPKIFYTYILNKVCVSTSLHARRFRSSSNISPNYPLKNQRPLFGHIQMKFQRHVQAHRSGKYHIFFPGEGNKEKKEKKMSVKILVQFSKEPVALPRSYCRDYFLFLYLSLSLYMYVSPSLFLSLSF